jgi:hypothetical protein
MLTALAVVLLVLVALIVLTRDHEPEDGDPHAQPSRELLSFKAEDITRLTLASAAGTLAFEKDADGWRMTEPNAVAVEESKVSEIVDALDGVKVQERPLEGERAGFGLGEDKRVKVELATADGTAFTVYVGDDAAVGYKSYVSEGADGPVLLADKRLAESSHRKADDFRTRKLLKVSAYSARRLFVEREGATVTLRKDDHGWWIGDNGPRADKKQVEDWFDKAAAAEAQSFLDGQDAGALGLNTPWARIRAESEDKTAELAMSTPNEAGEANARAGDLLVRVAKDVTDLARVTGWESTKLVDVRRYQVDRLEVKLGDRSAVFTRKDGVWSGTDGASGDAAEGLLDAIEAATALRTLAGSGSFQGQWGSISLAEGDERVETVNFGDPRDSGNRLAMDAAGGPTFWVPQADLDAIALKLPARNGTAVSAAPVPPGDGEGVLEKPPGSP